MNKIEKNDYVTPVVKVVDFQMEAIILVDSGENGGTEGTQEETW